MVMVEKKKKIYDLTEDSKAIASLLKTKRLEKKMTLKKCAEALKIRHTYLDAIEKNNLSKLPSLIYACGYIRMYAEYLDIKIHLKPLDKDGEEEREEKTHQVLSPNVQKFNNQSIVISVIALVITYIALAFWL